MTLLSYTGKPHTKMIAVELPIATNTFIYKYEVHDNTLGEGDGDVSANKTFA